MSWRKLEKMEHMGKFDGYDIVVRKNYISFPRRSKVLRYHIDEGIEKYSIFYDREEGKVAICLSSDGDYSFPRDYMIRETSGRKHYVVRIFNEILGIGKYVAKEEVINGKKCFVFGGEE